MSIISAKQIKGANCYGLSPKEVLALKSGEKKFRVLFESSPAPVLLEDMKGNIIDCNNATIKLFGYSRKELLKMSAADLVSEETAKMLPKISAKALAKGTFRVMNVNIKKDGTAFPVEVVGKVLKLEGRVRMFVTVNDLSRQKAAAERLKIETRNAILLNEIILTANRADNLQELLDEVLKKTAELMDFDGGGIYLTDIGGSTASLAAHYNLPRGFLNLVRTVKIMTAPNNLVFVKGKSIITEHYDKIAPKHQISFGLKSLISVPVFAGTQIIGAMNLATKKRYTISKGERLTIESIGKELGSTVRKLQVEEHLAVREQRYRTIIENSLDLIYSFDGRGVVTFISPNIRLLGYAGVSDILGKNFSHFVHPDDRARVAKDLRSALKTGASVMSKFRLKRQDGDFFYVEGNAKPAFGKNGKLVMFSGVMRDVSEKMKADEEFKNFAERLNIMFEDAPDAYYISDMKGILIDGNKMAESITGYSKSELIGRSFLKSKLMAPGQVRKAFALVVRNMKNKSTGPDEFKLIRKDGSAFYAEISTHPVKIGGKNLVLGIARDITERRLAADALRERIMEVEKTRKELLGVLADIQREKNLSESLAVDLGKFKLAVENVYDLIVITDADANIIFANKAAERITGYKVSEIIGKNPGRFWGGQMSRDYYKKMWRVIKTDKKIFLGELTNKRKNGESYDAELHVSPILNKEGNVVFFVGVERDITRAKETDRMKSEFVAVASHQLRTPLTGAKWYAELLLADKSSLSKKQVDYVKEIYKSNQKMIHLVNDLLNISRIESGRKFMIEKKPADISAILRRVIDDQTSVAGHNNVSIILSNWPQTRITMSVDGEKIYQVFSNLIGNAVKYSDPGGKVEIDVAAKKGKKVFSIRDYGIGIPFAQQDRAFEKFFRGQNVVESGKAGTGLGLYIAKAVVEAHGGKIWFVSNDGAASGEKPADAKSVISASRQIDENRGTTFYVELPNK
jgi:PAS domain S-box-containing protein